MSWSESVELVASRRWSVVAIVTYLSSRLVGLSSQRSRQLVVVVRELVGSFVVSSLVIVASAWRGVAERRVASRRVACAWRRVA
ncbi:hypothetical protein ACXZ9C_11255 [Streptococcus agalactiae]